jgi:hypothetical protein
MLCPSGAGEGPSGVSSTENGQGEADAMVSDPPAASEQPVQKVLVRKPKPASNAKALNDAFAAAAAADAAAKAAAAADAAAAVAAKAAAPKAAAPKAAVAPKQAPSASAEVSQVVKKRKPAEKVDRPDDIGVGDIVGVGVPGHDYYGPIVVHAIGQVFSYFQNTMFSLFL